MQGKGYKQFKEAFDKGEIEPDQIIEVYPRKNDSFNEASHGIVVDAVTLDNKIHGIMSQNYREVYSTKTRKMLEGRRWEITTIPVYSENG